MKRDNYITEVIFRREYKGEFKGNIIAVFPYEISDLQGGVLSYMHVGQHSGMDYNAVIDGTKPAKKNEYADLKSELESLGYNPKVVKRRNYDRYLKELRELRTVNSY